MEFKITMLKEFVEKGQGAQAAVDELTGASIGGDNGQALVPASLDLALVKPRFDEYLERVNLFEKSAQALEVRDEETREQAANLAGGAKKLTKAIDSRRLEVTKEAREFISKVNAFIEKFTSRLKSAADLAGEKELQYIKLQEMKRREQEKLAQEAAARLQKQIDKDAKKKGIEPIQVQAPVVAETKTTVRTEAGVTSYIHKIWTWEITNLSEIPEQYLKKIPDEKKLDEAVENGVREIPGVRIFEKEGIRHRS
jgi:hypothetical protein